MLILRVVQSSESMKNLFVLFALLSLIGLYACSNAGDQNAIVADDRHGDSVFVGYGTLEVLRHDIFRDYYVAGLSDYHPTDSLIDSLRGALESVSFRIVMGTWDSRSRIVVPRLVNVLFSAGNFDPTQRSNVELIGLDRSGKAGDIDLKPFKIKRLPLILVYRNGEELGRLEGKVVKPMELALLAILNKKK